MNKTLLTLLKCISEKFQVLIKKNKKISDQDATSSLSNSFNSLSPIDNADPEGEYVNALNWALKNRKTADIKNIALTGPYGSGKSSILKTFQNQNSDRDLSFLNISLATFKEETENENSPKGADLLRLIELSILQQMFYHEEDYKIPDSRFKKIKSFKRGHLWALSLGLFFLAAATIHLSDKTFFEDLIGFTAKAWFKATVNILSLITVVLGYFYILFKSIRTISSITINKLNINDAEIAISDSISKSILNNHIDEILYFFEVTNYTVVIIEDLDRFEQTEIFTKLRELNLLINYSDKIKRDIAFIYAVRDDMFKDKDRTKFFDFIIPVIPVINSSNSNEKLLEIINKNKYDIKPQLIENISFFIDDMRLLYNITNEYYIYHKKLGKLNQDKLMSMIVYKNIYPNDFVDLSNGEGKLYDVFNKKDTFLKEKQEAIDDQILEAQQEIKQLDAMLIIDIQELRRIYVYKYIEKLQGIYSFLINGNSYQFSEVITDDIFKYFTKDNVSYNFYSHYTSNYHIPSNGTVSIKFADIENEVDSEKTYQERLEMAQDRSNDKKEDLKNKIAELENEKNKIRQFKICDIVAMGGCKLELENKKQLQLVNILIRNSYIGEDYLDYISIFYEGSITKEDREFLLNVKAQIASDYDYKLNKIEKLIPKIDPVDFAQDYILNYNLVDHLIAKSTLKNRKNEVLGILKNESKVSIDFINGFIDQSKSCGSFIKEIAKVWPNMWHFIKQSTMPKEKLQTYFKLILKHADIADIKAIAGKSKLTAEISDIEDFLTIDVDKEKLKNIIKTLNIKFNQLDFLDGNEEVALYVYKNNHYVLNDLMVRTVINKYGHFEENNFNTKNYYSISESGCQELISYVETDIETYIANLYLNLTSNTEEQEEKFIELLNHNNLSLDTKFKVIDKVNTKIKELESIEDSEIAEYLLQTYKVAPIWNNLIYYYHWAEDSFEQCIIDFINLEDNAKEFSKVKVDIENPKPDLETVKKFLSSMILEENISNTSYGLILKSVPYHYRTLSLVDISREKVQMLVENFKLTLNVANYDQLRSEFSGLHIMLAEQKHTTFIEGLAEYVVEEPELFGLLSSSKLTIQEKNTLIAFVDETLITNSVRVGGMIGMLTINYDQIVVSKDIILHILSNRLDTERRIQLLIKKFNVLTKEETFGILSALPEPYSEIAILGKRPSLDGNQLNWELAGKLVNNGYIKRATDDKGKIRISTFRQ
ncbi:hypothetical protein ACR79M_13025 [Sphingobacterium spiritivorum]|uniref:YobI family P-loop NTPase n=1 Tax=Sphingobacterium spiritivorum TaxID=258 RepID=UPI003DA68B74